MSRKNETPEAKERRMARDRAYSKAHREQRNEQVKKDKLANPEKWKLRKKLDYINWLIRVEDNPKLWNDKLKRDKKWKDKQFKISITMPLPKNRYICESELK